MDALDVAALKRRLRLAIRARFARFGAVERGHETAVLLREIPRLDGFRDASTLLMYVGHLAEELPTIELIDEALGRGQRVLCPRVLGMDRPLSLHEIRDRTVDLVPGVLGIPEPRPGLAAIDPGEVDWALIPGLAFDASCRRLGRGAGHYDRLLPLLRDDVPRWAAAYSVQLVEVVPTDSFDRPLSGVLIPGQAFIRT